MNIFTCIGVFCKLYYLRGKLKTTRQGVFYTYRILTLSNYKKKTNKQKQKTKKQTDDWLRELILLFSGLRNIEEPIRL